MHFENAKIFRKGYFDNKDNKRARGSGVLKGGGLSP